MVFVFEYMTFFGKNIETMRLANINLDFNLNMQNRSHITNQ